jgi:dihydroorotate dehydrogenase
LGRKEGKMLSALASALMPLLHRLEPERAHALALLALRAGLAGRAKGEDDPILGQTLCGLRFPNPIGLAAGFDKNAVAVSQLMQLGFGFVEAGTVTLLPQSGNPRPRLFRLVEDQAIINRMGFNGAGLAKILERLAVVGLHPVPLGANLGLNRESTSPVHDYAALAAGLAPYVDYLTVNVSSPNTPGLRALQAPTSLAELLRSLVQTLPVPRPIFVKIAPDLDEETLEGVVETAIAGKAAGLIVANTTLARPAGLRSPFAREAGGLSGAPLFAPSTALLARASSLARGRLVLIGCGGIATGRQALAKIRAGAHLVQLYTAFAYAGPALIPRIKQQLAEALRADGFTSISQAVGIDSNKPPRAFIE